MRQIEAVTAGIFHAGNTCPNCQETVATGQLIVTCPQCGSVHHETCWTRKPGCASYHCGCDGPLQYGKCLPDIVINMSELANVCPPPAPVKRSAAEISAPFLPKKPERFSRLALASSIMAGCSMLGIIGVLAGSVPAVIIAIAAALCAMILGVFALVIINNTENRVYGFKAAGISVLAPAILIIILFVNLGSHLNRSSMQQQVDLKISENLPSEAQLQRMPAPAANAMRANVVIKCKNGILGETRYGSGIVIRLNNHKAYILTNKHVIGEQKNAAINVLFYNGEQSKSSIEWSAPEGVDIAIIACQVLSLDKYQPIKTTETMFGPGEKVFAIGNPMELSWSYTEGTISGVRENTTGERSVELYQTQTPINSGNSGGGLYTTAGMLIGVNTLTEDKAKTEGLNFAFALPVVLQVLDKETRERLLGPDSIERPAKVEDDKQF